MQLHTRECEVRGNVLAGIAIRIGGPAQPGLVLVATTVKDLVIGRGIEFRDRWIHKLKGVPAQMEALHNGQRPTVVKAQRGSPVSPLTG
jgi:hypothetical protein